MRELEEGGIFAQHRIVNFLEGDFFQWYLDAVEDPGLPRSLSEKVDDALRRVIATLIQYHFAVDLLTPESTRDLLKRVYEYLVPKRLRHDLGEYYTPDWLAELVLNEIGYDGDPNKRLLDPACGSGTFLVLAIARARRWLGEHATIPEREAAELILQNIVGFDINPLAVIAARANYVLALGPLLGQVRTRRIHIPVYQCDSVLAPQEQTQLTTTASKVPVYRLPTTQAEFLIPKALADERSLDELASALEHCVRNQYSADQFIAYCTDHTKLRKRTVAQCESVLGELYSKLSKLEGDHKNHIWARIIKNSFAPLFQAKFDYVAGNPPWINWESLSEEYKIATIDMWHKHGLFSLKGHAARLGGGKKDMAMLFAYACTDSYLKDGGKLGFLITQTVFKTKGAGDGFRRFKLGGGPDLKVLVTHDLVDVKPFEGAANRTGLIVWQKGTPTSYPVPYVAWRRGAHHVDEDDSLEEARAATNRVPLLAHPVDPSPTSPWLSAPAAALPVIEKVCGRSGYRAHAGSYTGGLNEVYWLEWIQPLVHELVLAKNAEGEGRIHLHAEPTALEGELVYPLLRGRDASRWKAEPSLYILMVQDPNTRVGYAEELVIRKWPHAHAYLKRFKRQLLDRASKAVPKDPFYSMYAISTYTFAPYKVVWPDMAPDLRACVVSTATASGIGTKPVIPEHHVMMVPFEEGAEAHYVCAVLNSVPSRLVCQCYMVLTQISTHLLENVAVSKFHPENQTHTALSDLSQQAHQLVSARGKAAYESEELRDIEEQIDEAAAQLWGLTARELDALRDALHLLA